MSRARLLTVPMVAGMSLISAGPAAGAPPECADIAPHTRMCRTSGHAAITTSPDPTLSNPYPGWGYGGLGIGLRGGGGFFSF